MTTFKEALDVVKGAAFVLKKLRIRFEDSYGEGMRIQVDDCIAELEALAAHEAVTADAEPVYQYRRADGSWIDQTKLSDQYNVKYGASEVRVLYAAPQPTVNAAAAQPAGDVNTELLTALDGLHEVCALALAGKDGQQYAYFESRAGHFVEATKAMQQAESAIQRATASPSQDAKPAESADAASLQLATSDRALWKDADK